MRRERCRCAGPGFVNTDFSVIKHFVPREGWRVDFRAEFFNLFNHPQFGAPGYDGIRRGLQYSAVRRDQLHGEQSAPGAVRAQAGFLSLS